MSVNLVDNQGRKKEKNQHIQVFVRVRPPNQSEGYGKSLSIVEVPSAREVVIRERPQDKLTKKFTFDRVFGPLSKQLDVYNAVVSPLLEEVLAGYNCTVFAYGQTGTGKTFTMEGLSHDPAIHWQSDTTAGIIPRSLSHLFDELRMLGSQEFTVRVSFLELYNEELFDLLSPSDDASKIRLYEDASKKGAVIIHGLEEVTVHNKNEVFKILEKGSEKRQTAATLMNAHSSRSHTVFSITVHIKENTVDGEELLKTGKLHLVDLAGSENVGRSGAVDRRAREAGNINQSLLTLGRVITALVERAPHIPYRESKLTRLLQESLGGRTKTSIIATISPASINLEETLSTLDYAHRAKNITNRPEINQKLSKKALLKEYTEEIERLRRDLQATRERNGVYLAHDNYNEMQTTIEFQGKEIEEKINHIKVLEETMATKEKLLYELKIDVESTKRQVKITEEERDEQKYLVRKHVKTESRLLKQAKKLLNVAETATSDTYKLHDKIDRKRSVEIKNETVGEEFKKNIDFQFNEIREDITNFTHQMCEFYELSKDEISNQKNNNSTFFLDSVQNLSRDLIDNRKKIVDDLIENVKVSHETYERWFENQVNDVTSLTETERAQLKKIAADFAPKISELFNNRIENKLRDVSEKTTENLISLRDATKSTIANLFNEFINERNSLKQQLESLKNDLKSVQQCAEDARDEEKEFMEINENYIRQINNWHGKQKQRRIAISEASNSGIESCKSSDVHINKISLNHDKIKTIIDDDLCPDMTKISKEFSEQLENNCQLVVKSSKLSENIICELENDLAKQCENLSRYKNEIEIQTNDQKRQIESNRDEILSLINKDSKVINDANKYYQKSTENHREQLETNVNATISQFDKQKSNTINWNGKMESTLTTTRNKIEKFWNDDLERDTPTGSTPLKKEFEFPRQLTTTSPHARILHRYRHQKSSKTEESSILENSFILNDDSTIVFPPENNEFKFSTPNVICRTRQKLLLASNSIVDNNVNSSGDVNPLFTKSASVSDLSEIVNKINPEIIIDDPITRSESDIYNKENTELIKNNDSGNGGKGFVKPSLRQPKSINKPQTTTKSIGKKILSSRNE